MTCGEYSNLLIQIRNPLHSGSCSTRMLRASRYTPSQCAISSKVAYTDLLRFRFRFRFRFRSLSCSLVLDTINTYILQVANQADPRTRPDQTRLEECSMLQHRSQATPYTGISIFIIEVRSSRPNHESAKDHEHLRDLIHVSGFGMEYSGIGIHKPIITTDLVTIFLHNYLHNSGS